MTTNVDPWDIEGAYLTAYDRDLPYEFQVEPCGCQGCGGEYNTCGYCRDCGPSCDDPHYNGATCKKCEPADEAAAELMQGEPSSDLCLDCGVKPAQNPVIYLCTPCEDNEQSAAALREYGVVIPPPNRGDPADVQRFYDAINTLAGG